MKEAARSVRFLQGWVPRICPSWIALSEASRLRASMTKNRLCQRLWCPSVENRDGWGSRTRGGARLGQPSPIECIGYNVYPSSRGAAYFPLPLENQGGTCKNRSVQSHKSA